MNESRRRQNAAVAHIVADPEIQLTENRVSIRLERQRIAVSIPSLKYHNNYNKIMQ